MPEDLLTRGLLPFRVWNRGGTRPVLALHCSLAHAGAWSGLAERLEGVTITAPDQPGHGRAPDWERGTDLHAITTAHCTALAEALGGGAPVDLMGHSFGATVALRIALERPDLVRSLVLVEPPLFAAARAAAAPAFAPFRAAHMAFAGLVRAGRLDAAAARFHAIWGTGGSLAELPEKTRAYMTARIHMIEAQNPVLLEDGAGLLRPQGLEAVRVPVLLVEGAESPPVIAAVQGELARRLPRAERLTVAGAGHMVPITHAAALAPHVQAHLAAS